MLRSRDEAQGSEAASVIGLSSGTYVLGNARLRDGDGRPIAGSAVGVADGRIAAIGDVRAVRRVLADRAQDVDCQGRTIVPGLIDPHVHLFGMAARTMELDCGAFGDVEGLLRAVRRTAAAHRPGEWVRGAGLDEATLGRLPTAAELDAAAPGHPVRLRHRSRHASVLSSLGRQRLGRVPRSAWQGDALVVGREGVVARAVGPLAAEQLAEGLRRVDDELVRRGVTCVGDASPRGRRAWEPVVTAMRADAFRLRVVAMARPAAHAWRGAERLECGGAKVMIEDEAGGLRPGPSAIARLIRTAADNGHRVAVHCVTAATLGAVLDGFAALPARLRTARRHRLEHVGQCPPPFVERIAALGLTVVTNPAFIHWRGDVYLREGEVPPGWLYRARSLAAAGVEIAAASDAPVVPCDPWQAIASARTRRTRGGVVVGAAERLSPRRAFALTCLGAARAAGAAALGRLRVGAPADLAVVGPDPVSATADELATADVALTMIGGRVVWEA